MRDRDVREAVRAYLYDAHKADRETLIVEEMGVWSGTVRIDIAVINGELSGFELKSDRDKLDRLPLQAKVYSKVFDRVTLVVGARHVRKALPLIPEWWSVLIANDRLGHISLSLERESNLNSEQDAILVAELLCKEEAIALLAEHELDRGWRAKRIRLLHQRLAENLPFDILKSSVRKALKTRVGWLRQHRPNELDVAIYPEADPVF